MSVVTPDLDSFAGAYKDDFAYALDNRLLLKWYPERVAIHAHGASLLELGVGHGYTTEFFSQRFQRHLVLDGSQQVISQFREQYPGCAADIDLIYFEEFETSEKFDNIVMGFILEHVSDPEFILNRFKSYLAPGGSIFIAVPNAEALNKRIGHAAGLLDDLMTLGPGDIALGHERLFTIKTLRELIKTTGFTEVTVEGLFLKPITTGQIKQLQLSEEILQGMMHVGVNYPELSVGLLMQIKAC